MATNTAGLPKASPEQERARELFLKQESLRIDAYAGSGKTTTLQMLANSNSRRGLYLALNRNIADAAKHAPHLPVLQARRRETVVTGITA